MEFPGNLESERDAKVGVALYFLALNEKLRGNRDKAKDYFAKMIAYSSPESWGAGYFPEVEFCKGLACNELGRFEEARKHFEALLVRSEDDIAIKTLATDHSAAFFPSLIGRKKINDDLADAYYGKGLAYLGLGETHKSEEMLKRTHELNPSHFGRKTLDKLCEAKR